MIEFLKGVGSSCAAAAIIAVVVKWVWPRFQDSCLYKGIRVDGTWDIHEIRNEKQTKAGRIELKQAGRRVAGSSVRSKRRDGKKSDRKFTYKGVISGHQLTLVFEDAKGVGFDTGTYVFIVQNDGNTMIGMATFYGRTENRIVSEPRTLKKVLT